MLDLSTALCVRPVPVRVCARDLAILTALAEITLTQLQQSHTKAAHTLAAVRHSPHASDLSLYGNTLVATHGDRLTRFGN